MGATASCSSPPTPMRVMTIPDYSKLVRVPDALTVGTIFFHNFWCNIEVHPKLFNEEGIADVLVVLFAIDLSWHDLYCGASTHISIDILDETGEQTVFHEEGTLEVEGCSHELLLKGKPYMWKLALNRRELEAASCICLKCFTIRCTWSFVDVKKKRRRLGGIFSKSRKKPTVLAPQ
jgi:hypothetical protein